MRWRQAIPVAFVLAGTLGSGAKAGPDGPVDGPRCMGKAATVVGTTGDDLLRGTIGRDVIWAGPGNDVVHGERGNDLICGGSGSDLVDGGRNNDRVDGGPGDGDRSYGGLGDDQVNGGPGDGDEAAGHLGIDLVTGGPGDADYVHGDYGWDRMDGGPGKGDIASFATAHTGGVWVSLTAKKARGDGRDRLYRFDAIAGSPQGDVLIGDKTANQVTGGAGDDLIRGGGGRDRIDGGSGSDRCRDAMARVSCGPEKVPKGSALVEVDPAPPGGGGLAILGGEGRDVLEVTFDPLGQTFFIHATAPVTPGGGCTQEGLGPRSVFCEIGGPARWLIADLGPGDDRLRVLGDMSEVGQVRVAGGAGDDVIHGGPEDDLIESGPGADRIFGGAGEDGLVGGLPGPTLISGGAEGDLLAAGGGCAGGALIGGGGRDNASFAETQAHPGRLIVSLPAGKAWIDVIKNCDPVRLDHSNEDIEGSFDNDVLIGDRRANSLLGQPGQDIFYGGGGGDTINALDKVEDLIIHCGRPNRNGRSSGKALLDPQDPKPSCAKSGGGKSTPGLHHEH